MGTRGKGATLRYRAARTARLYGEAHAELPALLEHADRVVALVTAYRAATGQGPAWALLAHELGVSRMQVEALLVELRRQGRVSYTARRGSLRAVAAEASPAA